MALVSESTDASSHEEVAVMRPDRVLFASLEHVIEYEGGREKAIAGGLGKVAGLMCRYHPGSLICVTACMPGKDSGASASRDARRRGFRSEVHLDVAASGTNSAIFLAYAQSSARPIRRSCVGLAELVQAGSVLPASTDHMGSRPTTFPRHNSLRDRATQALEMP